MVARVGLEPTTYRVWTDRSSQLSYLARINGRDDRIRTCDTLIPNQVLYQAELHPENTNKLMARPVGLEPATFWSVVKRSIQLSYGRKNITGGDGGIWTLTVLLPRDFKSLASTVPPHPQWRFLPDSNRWSQSCSLLPYHLAKEPHRISVPIYSNNNGLKKQ